jgi:hypothetical protein
VKRDSNDRPSKREENQYSIVEQIIQFPILSFVSFVPSSVPFVFVLVNETRKLAPTPEMRCSRPS